MRLIVVMFFKERTTEWLEPKIPASLATVIFITVMGVFYLGLFSDNILDAFKRQPAKTTVSVNSTK